MEASVYGGDAGEEGVNLFSLTDFYESVICFYEIVMI